MKSMLLAGSALLLLAACNTTHLPRTTGQAEQTVAVSTSQLDLTPEMRNALKDLGWRLVEYDPEQVEGDALALAERARYRLQMTTSAVGSCGVGEASFAYEIEFIDNRSGKTPVSLVGAGCEFEVIDRFKRAMQRENLSPD